MEFTELPQKYEDIYIQAIRCENTKFLQRIERELRCRIQDPVATTLMPKTTYRFISYFLKQNLIRPDFKPNTSQTILLTKQTSLP